MTSSVTVTAGLLVTLPSSARQSSLPEPTSLAIDDTWVARLRFVENALAQDGGAVDLLEGTAVLLQTCGAEPSDEAGPQNQRQQDPNDTLPRLALFSHGWFLACSSRVPSGATSPKSARRSSPGS